MSALIIREVVRSNYDPYALRVFMSRPPTDEEVEAIRALLKAGANVVPGTVNIASNGRDAYGSVKPETPEPPDPPCPPTHQSADRDAYEGAREELLDWKSRAQRAEARLRALGYQGVDASAPPVPPPYTLPSAEINELPEHVRKYIMWLETDADPAGTIRENFRLNEENKALRVMLERVDTMQEQQAVAWQAVADLMRELDGDWPLRGGTNGREAMCSAIRRIYDQRNTLRAALVALVGTDTPTELAELYTLSKNSRIDVAISERDAILQAIKALQECRP